MMMWLYWAKTIPARWFRRAVPGILTITLAASSVAAETPGALARAFRTAPSPANAAALERFASAHPNDRDGALALLALGVTAREQHQPGEAIQKLTAARGRVPRLADYFDYYIAAAQSDLGNFPAAIALLETLWTAAPASPLGADAAMLAARAYKETGKPAEAVAVLRRYYSQLSQPAGDLLLAASYRAANDLASAAAYNQRVYYQYPITPEAEQAASALAELKASLGALYPPPTSEAMFQRADRWARAGEYRKARMEYDSIAAQTTGADREVARVRIGELDFLRYENNAALSYLRSLDLSSEEGDAERLYYIVELARRMDRDGDIADSIKRLERYPHSPWRLKALVSAGNHYLLQNQSAVYEPMYRACYESFPDDPQADYCHWKVAWIEYLHRNESAVELLREHLVKFPGSERSSGALYFLGRAEENAGHPDEAKAYYTEASERFPNHYYADLAERRLSQPAVFRAIASSGVMEFLNSVVWPIRKYPAKFDATAATQTRIERARLLEAAGLDDLAERELRFGARTDAQPHILAIHLAQMASAYDAPHRAMRLVKGMVPGYLSIPIEDAPASFWRLLYPLPWRSTLERYAREHGLDPFLVAGLIRQESEFNPEAVSPARAYGLTQIMPATGRQLLKVSRRRFRPAILFRPEVNLRLGTTFLRQMYDAHAGKWELVLAAYNAGGGRVAGWSSWADYREPAEFVETIPFSETRQYVFAVLRNAEMYRKLYGREGPGVLAADGGLPPPLAKSLAKAAAPRKATAFKRSPVVSKKHVRRHRTSRRAQARRSTPKRAPRR